MTAHALVVNRVALEEYVERGREHLARKLPGQDFDAPSWDSSGLSESASEKTQRIYFTLLGSQVEDLPKSFAGGAKAWIAITAKGASRMAFLTFMLRHLWPAISERLGNDAGTLFSWPGLQHADLHRAEQLMVERGLAHSTVYKSATALGQLARDLYRAGCGPAITYTPFTSRYADSNNVRLGDIDERGDGILTPAAQSALADIFHRATEPRDVFCSSLLALMVATGLRWNEAVTLPVDPFVDEEIEVRAATGEHKRVVVRAIRYFKSKSRRAGSGGAKALERLMLTDAQAELAGRAIERLREVTAEGRVLAATLEATAPHWLAPAGAPSFLHRDDLVALLGIGIDPANYLLRKHGEPLEGTQRPVRGIARGTLEAVMTRRQDWGLLQVVHPAAGHEGLSASRALCVLRQNQLGAVKGTLPLLIFPNHVTIAKWLQGDDVRASVFERFESAFNVRYREPDGALVRITSHMCRRLFVTTGLTAGATLVDMMRWQNREHFGDLRAYDKRSLVERTAAVREAIVAGRLRGQVAQTYVRLTGDVRDEWLEGQVQAMHVTPWGLCVHDFAVTPCAYSLNCVKGCKDHLHDPTDQVTRTALVQLQRRVKDVVAQMAQQPNVAASWSDEQQETLRGLDRILSLAPQSGGGYVQTAPDEPSRFQPATPEV